MPFDSVLLIGFGGPGKPEEICPFLDNVLSGRPVPPARFEQVVKQYELIGGRSPYNDLTFRQAKALEKELERTGAPLPVYVGMRNWDPYYKDTIRRMITDGRKQAAGFILAPHRSEASWDRYQEGIKAARKEAGSGSPEVTYLDPWHDHPQFLQAAASRIQEVLVQDVLEQDTDTELSSNGADLYGPFPSRIHGRAVFLRGGDSRLGPGCGHPARYVALVRGLSEPQREPARPVAWSRHQ